MAREHPGQVAPALPAAVLWDMDGTLLDTEPYWIEQERRLVASYGGTWSDEDAHNLVGNALLVSAQYIRDHSPVDLEPLEIVDRLQSGVIARLREQVPWRPGALELLTGLREAGCRARSSRCRGGSWSTSSWTSCRRGRSRRSSPATK